MIAKARAFTHGWRRVILITMAAVILLSIYSLYCYALSDSRGVLIFSLMVSILFVGAYAAASVWRLKQGLRVEIVFLFAVVSLGFLFSIVFAPSTVPDEMYHFQSSYKMSNLLLFVSTASDSLLVRSDDANMIAQLFAGGNLLDPGHYYGVLSSPFFVEDPSLVPIDPVSDFDFGSNPPQVKLASGMGIALGRLLHLGSYPTFYLGRAFNFLFFVGLVYLAMRVTPVGKRVMMAVALLPMTLHVASSYSYDAGIIGLGFLLTGLCLRAVLGSGSISRRLCVSIALVAVLMAPCKIVYVVLILAVIAIPESRFSSKKNAILYKSGVLVLSLISVSVMRMASLAQVAGLDVGSDELYVRGEESGSLYTLKGILSDPVGTVLIYLRTFDSMGDMYLGTVVGRSLGWFQADLEAPWYIAVAFLFVLALSAVRWRKDGVLISSRNRAFFICLVGAGWLAIMLSMLVGWTFDSESVIQGVQGRYLLPMLPLLLIAFQSGNLEANKDYSWKIVWLASLLDCGYLMRILTTVMSVG